MQGLPHGKVRGTYPENVNLDVEEGEYLAIMGPSGSGKTTLMNLIGCLDVPTSGSYLLGGRDVTTCNNKQLAEVRNKELGFVFQSFNLLPKLTALENVALPLLYGGVKRRSGWSAPAPRWRRWVCPTGWSTAPTSCPADSASAWPSPAPSWASPSSCWPTSLPARWIPPAAHRSWSCSSSSIRAAPPLS